MRQLLPPDPGGEVSLPCLSIIDQPRFEWRGFMLQLLIGIVYIVTGQRFIGEAARSAASVKRHMPHLPITIISLIRKK